MALGGMGALKLAQMAVIALLVAPALLLMVLAGMVARIGESNKNASKALRNETPKRSIRSRFAGHSLFGLSKV